MRASHLLLRVFAALLLAAGFAAHADDTPKKVKYVPPAGFDGHLWGEIRTSPGFAPLPAGPMGVGAAWMQPVEKDVTFTCVPVGGLAMEMGGAAGSCDFNATLDSLRRRFEGGGFYVLDCKDLDEAIEWAAKIPGAQHGSVEIRPVMVFDEAGNLVEEATA